MENGMMNKVERDFILLTQYVATNKLEKDNDWENTDWKALFELCNTNKLVASTYDLVKELPVAPKELLKSWEQFRLMTFFRQKKCFHSLKSLLEDISNQGISYALFKGNIIADLYQNPYDRLSSDSDIYVDEKDREIVTNIIMNHGYEYVPEDSKDFLVSAFINRGVGHKIELHTCLFEDYKGSQIDLLKDMNLTDESKRLLLNIDGAQIWTLGHMEHLIYQLFHFIKHFIVEGVSIRYLIDITLFINRYFDEISWDVFWEKMQILRYESFCERFFFLCEKYYGLNPKVLQTRKCELGEQAEEALLLDLMYKGNSSQSRQMDWQLIGSLKGYLEGEKTEVTGSPFYKKLRTYFPNQEDLNDYYMYAKKHKYLVPVAWIHRLFHGMKFRSENKDAYSVKEKAKAIDERERMIISLGLANEEK